MIPILYSKTEQDFTSNGLGRLADATSCIVTEERNGIFELEMTYPMSGVHFNDIAPDCYIKTICNAKKRTQLFRVYSITKPINGRCKIYAEHVSYQMLHIPLLPFTAQGAAAVMAAIPSHVVGDCPFTFETDIVSTRTYTLNYPKSLRGALQGDQWSILQNYGGDYEWDNWTVRLLAQRGQDKGVILRYGKNIIDLKQEENIQQTYTGIIPYWYGMDGEKESLVMLPEVTLYADTASNFPYSRILAVDFTDQLTEKPTQAELREMGENYIERNDIGYPSVSISLSFIDLSQTEEYKDLAVETLNLCDVITVYFSELGVYKQARITRTKYNVLTERYTNLYIGEAYHSLASIISDQSVAVGEVVTATRDKIANAIEQQTAVINGSIEGSSMITLTDQNGNPRGWVILDTYNESTARNCIRANINGIGFSTQGANGPYDTAIYYDATKGKWVIDSNYLNAINLNASNITSGTIDASEIGVINLDASNISTGTMSANKINGGSIDASNVTITNLNASNITSGTLSADMISTNSIDSTKLATAINTSLENGVTAYNRKNVYRGTCSTANGTAAKVVSCSGFTLETGAAITVYFSTANTNTAAFTLNVNSTGAKNVYIGGTQQGTTNQLLWNSGSSITFVYNGTGYVVADLPAVYYGTACSVAAATAAKTSNANNGRAVIMLGTKVAVPMTYANTNTSATLNVSGLGAKAIYYGTSTTRPTTSNGHGWVAGETVEFIFDGAYWRIQEPGTIINGSHITTGTIDASVVTVSNINASNIKTGTLDASVVTVSNINASNIKSGTLTVGGNNNGNGKISVLNSSGNSIGTWDKDGINTVSGKIGGWTITDTAISSTGTNYVVTMDAGTQKEIFTTYTSSSGAQKASVRSGQLEFKSSTASGTLMSAGSVQGSVPVTNLDGFGRISIYATKSFAMHAASTSNVIAYQENNSSLDYPSGYHSGYLYLQPKVGVYTTKNFTCTGTKSRAVSTNQYSNRLLYCYETPSPLFGDVGEGVTDETGLCYIFLDPVFAETITTSQYQVFIQKYGAGDLYVAERHPGYFVVKGTPDLSFGWELKAKQSDYDQMRLEKSDSEFSVPEENYGDLAADYIQQLTEERLSA